MHGISVRRLTALTMMVVTTAATSVVWPGDTEAGRNVRNTTRKNVNRNVNQNRNTNINQNRNVNVNRNVNRNVNIDRDVDIDVDVDRGWGLGAVAAGAAVATATAVVTSAVIGSVINTLPPACSVVVVNGVTYQQCGSAWYQPQYVGTQVSYVVVNPPR